MPSQSLEEQRNALSMAHDAMMLEDSQAVLKLDRWQTKQHAAKHSGGTPPAESENVIHIGDTITNQAPQQPSNGLSTLAKLGMAAALMGTGVGAGAAIPLAIDALKSKPAEVQPYEGDGNTQYDLVMPSALAWQSTVDVTAPVVVVLGARGDGVSDDVLAFQRAVDSIVDTGGVVWIPPDKSYAIGSTVKIRSKYSVWLKSAMGGRLSGGGTNTTHADRGLIRPLRPLTYLFEWDTPPGLSYGEAGGGGMEGLSFTDWIMPSTPRSVRIEGAVNVARAPMFTIRDCNFEWLNGRAIRLGTTTHTRLRDLKIHACGASKKPPLDIDGAGSNGFAWVDGMFIENCNYQSQESWVRVNRDCLLNAKSLYFEAGMDDTFIRPAGTYIDGREGGTIVLDGCTFNGTSGKSLTLNARQCIVRNSQFASFPVNGLPVIELLGGAVLCQLQNLHFSVVTQGGPIIKLSGYWAQLSDLVLSGAAMGSPLIDARPSTGSLLANVYLYLTVANTAGPYAIELGSNELNGGFLEGNGASCHGVRTTSGAIRDYTVRGLKGTPFTAGDGAILTGSREVQR